MKALVTTGLAGATSHPGYLDLKLWFYRSSRRTARARQATPVTRPPKAAPRRQPADIERHPAESTHLCR